MVVDLWSCHIIIMFVLRRERECEEKIHLLQKENEEMKMEISGMYIIYHHCSSHNFLVCHM